MVVDDSISRRGQASLSWRDGSLWGYYSDLDSSSDWNKIPTPVQAAFRQYPDDQTLRYGELGSAGSVDVEPHTVCTLELEGEEYAAFVCGAETTWQPAVPTQPGSDILTGSRVWLAVHKEPRTEAFRAAAREQPKGPPDWSYALFCIEEVQRAIRDLRALELDSLHRLPLDYLEADLAELSNYVRGEQLPELGRMKRQLERWRSFFTSVREEWIQPALISAVTSNLDRLVRLLGEAN